MALTEALVVGTIFLLLGASLFRWADKLSANNRNILDLLLDRKTNRLVPVVTSAALRLVRDASTVPGYEAVTAEARATIQSEITSDQFRDGLQRRIDTTPLAAQHLTGIDRLMANATEVIGERDEIQRWFDGAVSSGRLGANRFFWAGGFLVSGYILSFVSVAEDFPYGNGVRQAVEWLTTALPMVAAIYVLLGFTALSEARKFFREFEKIAHAEKLAPDAGLFEFEWLARFGKTQ